MDHPTMYFKPFRIKARMLFDRKLCCSDKQTLKRNYTFYSFEVVLTRPFMFLLLPSSLYTSDTLRTKLSSKYISYPSALHLQFTYTKSSDVNEFLTHQLCPYKFPKTLTLVFQVPVVRIVGDGRSKPERRSLASAAVQRELLRQVEQLVQRAALPKCLELL